MTLEISAAARDALAQWLITARALKGMVALSLAYLAAASALTPGLWLDPIGPLVKVVPSVLLALATLAILDER